MNQEVEMEEDRAPLNAMAIEFGAFGKTFVELVQSLRKNKLDSFEATTAALELAQLYLNFSNAKKFADTMTEVTYTPAEE